MKKNLLVINRALAIFMVLITVILSLNITSIAAEQTLPEQVVSYYKDNDTKLDSWWELVAINGAGENLKESPWEPMEWKEEDYSLETVSTSDYVGMILGTLAKNDNPEILFEERNIVNELIDRQNQETGQIDQWLNLHIWAMIALSQSDKEYNDDLAVEYLLSQQKQDGGFNIFGDNGDPDITGMALLALAPLIEEDSVEQAVSNAIIYLKSVQNPSGGFSSWGTENTNSIATVISGLIAVGEDIEAAEWLKNGNSMIDALLSFQLQDKSFSYDISGQSNASATAQALIAINDAEINTSTLLGLRYQEPIENNVNINLCVEGSEASLINKNIEVVYSEEALTAMDALKQALTEENIEYNITNSAWGEYINSIAGDTSGKFGGWDGWLFAINGELASVGADSYLIQENDKITFYYGMYPPDTYFPEITLSSQESIIGQDTILTVSTSYFDWNTNSEVEIKLQGIKVEFDNREYITDANGEVILESPFFAGEYICNISKENTDSYPAIVRQTRIISYIEPEQSEPDEEELNESNNQIEVALQSVNLRLTDNDNPVVLSVQTNLENEVVSAELPYINTVSETQAGDIRMTIPAATRVESSAGWDGKIRLPKLIVNSALSINNANINQILEVGSADYSLNFDKPVRLLFPNFAGKSIGFADINGNVHEITSVLPEDSYEEAEKILPNAEAKIDVGNDLIVWTKHFTKFVVYTEDSEEEKASETEKKEIYITVKGYNSTMLGKTKLAITANETAYSALVKVIGSSKIKTKGSGSDIYVIAINNLAEFDKGAQSGWMYKVNGTSPNKGAGSYYLKDGDNLTWYYTTELEEEEIETIIPAGQIITSKKLEAEKELLSSYLYKEEPSMWSIFALARAGRDVDKYKSIITRDILENKAGYSKATDLSKIILSAAAADLDPENIENVNLIEMLLKYEKIDKQGVTGPVFGLIALNSRDYKTEDNFPLKEAELLNLIVSYQNKDGGFCLYKDGKSSIDITAMVLQALAYYKTNKLPENADINQEQFNEILQSSVSWLAKNQLENGGFNEWGIYSSESISQVIIALAALDINPLSKEFVKEKGNLISALLSFSTKEGGYSHIVEEKANEMASEQALMAYEAYSRFNEKVEKLFEIPNSKIFSDQEEFSSWSKEYILKSSKYNLMTGIKNKDEKLYFNSQEQISRAEFTVVLMRLLNEEPVNNSNNTFVDVKDGSWYEKYVYAAYKKGVIKGIDEGLFSPEKSITREEMATMINRAFELSKKNTGEKTSSELKINDTAMIAPFAIESVTAVYNKDIMVGDGLSFKPKSIVTREMTAVIAVKLYEMQRASQNH